MNSFSKLLFTLASYFFIRVSICAESHPFFADPDNERKTKNLIQNMTQKLSPEEFDVFIKEYERTQEMIEKMSPEELEQLKGAVAEQMEFYMSDESPIKDMFDDPPESADKAQPATPAAKEEPKQQIQKNKYSNELLQELVKLHQASHALLQKTEKLDFVQLQQWDKEKWQQAKEQLTTIHAQTQDKTIKTKVQELSDKDAQAFLQELQKAVAFLKKSIDELAMPDTLGLVQLTKEKETVINKALYEKTLATIQQQMQQLLGNSHLVTVREQLHGLAGTVVEAISKPSLVPPAQKSPAKQRGKKKKPTAKKEDCLDKKQFELVNKQIAHLEALINEELLCLVAQLGQQDEPASLQKIQWKLTELQAGYTKLERQLQKVNKATRQASKQIVKQFAEKKEVQRLTDLLQKVPQTHTVRPLAKNIVEKHAQSILVE